MNPNLLADVENAILTNRQQYRDGRFTYKWHAVNKAHAIDSSGMSEVYVLQAKRRHDRIDSKGVRHVLAVGVEGSHEVMFVDPDDERDTAVSVDLPSSRKTALPHGLLYPESFGLDAFPMVGLLEPKLDTFVGSKNHRTEISVVESEANGLPCFIISFKLLGTVPCKYWCDKVAPHFISRVEIDTPDLSSHLVATRFPDGRHPGYPKIVKFTRKQGGKLTIDETIECTHAEPGSGVDPIAFTWAGLNVPPGKLIHFSGKKGVPDSSKMMTFDGTKLVKVEPSAKPKPVPFQRVTWDNTTTISLVLAVLAGVLLWYGLRRRAST